MPRNAKPPSCECGTCEKCRKQAAQIRYKEANRESINRKQAERRRKEPGKAREISKRWYANLSPEGRRARNVERAEYQRQYKEANRARIKELNAALYTKKRDERRIQNKAKYAADPEAARARARARHAAYPKAVAERASKWNKENPERRSIIGKVSSHKRRARIEGAGGTVTEDELRVLFKRQGSKCAGCKKRLGKFGDGKWHHDHVMPIALGGANTIENAQILCQSCNCRKQAKHPERWAAELGRLFA